MFLKLSPVVLLASLTAFAAEPPPQVCFQRDSDIYVANADGKNSKKVADGDLPQISPDGTTVAFTTDNEAIDKQPVRHIALADVASGKVTVLKGIPSNNSFGPVWSPNGKTLLFSILEKDAWEIGLVNADGTGFRVVKKASNVSDSSFKPCWATDGQSFFCHDLEAIYHCDLDGKVLKKWAIHDIVKKGDMSSNCRLSVSPDGSALLMDVEMDEDQQRKNWEGPPPALWLLKLDATKATRLTKKEFFAWDACWISNDEFLFLSQGPKEETPSIYRGSIKGGDYKLITKNAHTPSVSVK